MSPTNIYKALVDLFPGISVSRYRQYKFSRNTIWFEAEVGRPMLFTYISPSNFCLRTEFYQKKEEKG
jgi:hypothetical protein